MKRRALAPMAPFARLIPAPRPSPRADASAYANWAESEGRRLYAMQQVEHRAQLLALTGGMPVEAFIAARQAESVRMLNSVRSALSTFVSSSGGPSEPPGFARIDATAGPFFRSTLASY